MFQAIRLFINHVHKKKKSGQYIFNQYSNGRLLFLISYYSLKPT